MINIFCSLKLNCTFAQNFNQITNQKTKQMKKLTKAVLAILVVASSITACKKGDDDPGMSLKSRKGRLSQEWTISEYKSDITSISNSYSGSSTFTNTTNTVETYTGSTASKITTETGASGGTTSTDKFTYTGTVTSYDYTFDKDGTWSSTMTVKWTSLTVLSNGVSTTNAIDQTETQIASGNWYFLGKNKNTEDKNKENLSLSVTSVQTKTDTKDTGGSGFASLDDITTKYANNENTQTWHLSRLAKDELVADVTVDMSVSGTESTTFGGSTTIDKVGPNSSKGTISVTMAVK